MWRWWDGGASTTRWWTRRRTNGVEAFGYTANVAGPTSYTNQLAQVMLYAYDPLGRKTNEVFVGMATNSFTYSPASDLLTLRDGKNQVTTWAYNTQGLVTHKWDARGTNILQYLYDALYRLTNMVDAAGTTAYGYWPGAGLKTENGRWASDIITYTNNAAGMRQSLTVEQPSGSWQVSYAYDPAKRLTSLVSPAATFAYTYRGAGLLWTNLALPNTAAITNDYDGMARLRWRFAGASTGFAGASPGQAPASLALRRGKLRLCLVPQSGTVAVCRRRPAGLGTL
jgi:YD repeat-containing protein